MNTKKWPTLKYEWCEYMIRWSFQHRTAVIRANEKASTRLGKCAATGPPAGTIGASVLSLEWLSRGPNTETSTGDC